MLSPTSALNQYDDTVDTNLQRLFAVTGRRCYLIGALNGAFPDLGHHLPGEMGGIWVAPIKIADGFWFGISPQSDPSQTAWMHGSACKSFTMRPGRADRAFLLEINGATVEASQTLFVPDEEQGVLIEVTLTNTSSDTVDVTLEWLIRWDVQGAWWSHWPDREDVAAQAAHGVTAWDSLNPDWCGAAFGSDTPSNFTSGPNLWGPQQTSSLIGEIGLTQGGILPNPEELQGAGVSSLLSYNLTLEPGTDKTMRFAIAGGIEGTNHTVQKAQDLIAHYDDLLETKLTRQSELIASMSSIETPDANMDRAYSVQNLCLDMMTFTLPGVGTGATAGLPSFVWFFGCDTYYSVSGLLVGGQAQTALSTLRILADYAGKQGGRTPHEITPTGVLFNSGNTVETGEFATSVERAYRFTGDRAFLDEMYPLCKQGLLDYVLGECTPDGSYLPDGAGLLELRSAGRGKKLDVAAALHQGLGSLAYMASVVGDNATHERAIELRSKVHHAIEQHFWQPDRQEYVWRIEQDLSVEPDEPAHSYVMTETAVIEGSDPRVANLFATVEGPEHTSPKGIVHPGTDDFVMPIQNAIVALAELQYSRPDEGLWYLQRMSELAGQAMPWAIPEFEGEYGDDKACFMQLWSSAAYNWLMVQGWFRLLPDPAADVIWVRPQLPADWDSAEVRNLEIWGSRYNLSLRRENDKISFKATSLSGGSAHYFRVVENPETPVVFS